MNPYLNRNKTYQKAAVTTLDQGTLIMMLYDGAIKFMNIALVKIEKNELEGAHNAITRSKEIIAELMGSLKTEGTGDVAKNLKSMYSYMYDRLIDANIRKDVEIINEIIALMDELRDGWKVVLKERKQTAQANSRVQAKKIEING